jgi:hypothetical protein
LDHAVHQRCSAIQGESQALAHLSLRQYHAPTGEMVPLLQISPSKNDTERVIPADPELVAVLARRLVLVGTGPRGGDAIARQAPEVGPLFTRRDELGEDMWLPIMFSPSKESQASGRAFISRITARTNDRDIPVSDETIAAYRAAARGWA